VLHRFTGRDGSLPTAALILDGVGRLYGTTQAGGNSGCYHGLGCGVAFRLAPNSTGGWDHTALHYFVDHSGANPLAGLIFDPAGNLYGTTAGDDTTTFGSVFMITP